MKCTILDQVEVLRGGSIRVRLKKGVALGDGFQLIEFHRPEEIPAGCDEARIRFIIAENEKALAGMGYPIASDAEWDKLFVAVEAHWTDENRAAFEAAKALRASADAANRAEAEAAEQARLAAEEAKFRAAVAAEVQRAMGK